MPVVPRRTDARVETAPLPGVRVPTDVPVRAFGAPEQPDLSGVQRNITELVQREREKADTTALLDADNQLATLQTDLHTQATALRGKDALGATEQVSQGWQKGTSEIAASLHTDDQRRAFSNRVGARWGALYAAVEEHASTEHERYVAETADAAVNNRLNYAIQFSQTPGAISEAVDETKAIYADMGKHQGWSPDVVTDRTNAAVSRIHAGVIDRLIAQGNDLDAASYLTAHHDALQGKELVDAEQLVEKGSVIGASQRTADTILKGRTHGVVDRIEDTPTGRVAVVEIDDGQGGELRFENVPVAKLTGAAEEGASVQFDRPAPATLDAALEQAARITNPRVRDQVEDRIRRSFEDRAANLRQVQMAAEQKGGQLILSGTSFLDLPPSITKDLSPDQLRGLSLLETAHRKKSSDQSTLNGLNNMAGLQPDEFRKLDLSQFHDQLAEPDYNRLVSRQLTLRTGEVRGETRAAAATRTRQSKVLTQLQSEAASRKNLGMAIPDSLARQIKSLQDSMRPASPASARAAAVPGAPIAKPVSPAKPTSASLSPGALPLLVLPGSKPPTSSPDISAGPLVPRTWLDHASSDPAYAAYLATMGVDVG